MYHYLHHQICLSLVQATTLVFYQVISHEFCLHQLQVLSHHLHQVYFIVSAHLLSALIVQKPGMIVMAQSIIARGICKRKTVLIMVTIIETLIKLQMKRAVLVEEEPTLALQVLPPVTATAIYLLSLPKLVPILH